MKIVIACERSGIIREAFRARGHDAWSLDLEPAEDGSQFHIRGDVFEHLDRDWDLMICHPECTYLTNSAAWAFSDGPYHQTIKPGTLTGQARREARERAVDFARRLYEAPIEKIAMENPIGHLNTVIGKPAQIIQPFQFGEDASKGTCLWLRNLPTLAPTEFVFPRLVCKICGAVTPPSQYKEARRKIGCYACLAEPAFLLPRWGNQTDSGQNKIGPSQRRSMDRARTYPGIARAMAEQWGTIST